MAQNNGSLSVTDGFLASRVTILDSHEVDEDLIQILKAQLCQVLKYFPSWILTRHYSELDLALQLFLHQQSLIRNQSTFVQQMFQLKYSNITDSHFKSSMFVLCHVLGAYARQKSDEFSMYMRRRGKMAYLTFKYVDVVLGVLELINLIVFLNGGEYFSTAERLFQMKLVSKTRTPRRIEYSYLSRELLYQSLTELLLLLHPLLRSPKLRQTLSSWFPFGSKHTALTSAEVPVLRLNNKCSACSRFPWQPYHIQCQHVFCYYCLMATCKVAEDKFECCVCSHSNGEVHSFAFSTK